MWMYGKDTNYMEWLESELREMDVDTDTIHMVMYKEQSELQDIAVIGTQDKKES